MSADALPDDATVIPVRVEGSGGAVGGSAPAAEVDDPDAGEGHHLLPRERARRTLSTLLPEAEMPVVGPEAEGAAERGLVAAPRLARHVFTLSDGHQVGVTVSPAPLNA